MEPDRSNLERGATYVDPDVVADHVRLLQVTVDASPTGFLVVDDDGRILLANAHVHAMLGYERGELVGVAVETLVPPDVRDEHPRLRAAFREHPSVRPMGGGRDLFAVRKDGRQIPVEIGLCPELTADGHVVVCSVVDITERTRARMRLEQTVRALRASNRTLEELAQVVAHDVRAPLRGIAATAQWLSEDLASTADAQSLDNLSLLRRRTEHLMELVEGVLRYSRAGLDTAAHAEVDAEEVVRNVLDALEIPDRIEVCIESPLPRVEYDRTQLTQVLQNLIGNAIVHLGRPKGQVRVSATDEGDAWCFTVSDDGVGIPDDQQERVFGLFQRAKRASGEDEGRPGIGLGLAIVRRIVENAGGAVRVRSEPDRGTELSFTVPRAPETAEPKPVGSTGGDP